jgi:multiple antibiotic resistance protein
VDAFSKSFLLFIVLLNPFIMSIYLLELVKALQFGELARQLVRASLISFAVFAVFAWGGEVLF